MFSALLERLAEALERAAIPYMVIGGQAVLLHGEPRLTRDVDLTLGVDVDRLPDVLAAARGCRLEPLVDPEDFVNKTMVLPCLDPESGIRVDLVFSWSPYEREAIARALTVPVGGVGVRYATAEDLVIHKILAGRARDLEDVRGVLLKNPTLDQVRIESVLAEIGAVTSEALVDRFRAIVNDIET